MGLGKDSLINPQDHFVRIISRLHFVSHLLCKSFVSLHIIIAWEFSCFDGFLLDAVCLIYGSQIPWFDAFVEETSMKQDSSFNDTLGRPS